MASAAKPAPAQFSLAKVTSKGQVTIPVEVRKSLGVKPGDKLRFEPQDGGFRVVREIEENVFEKWRGIGIDGIAPGAEGVAAYMREIRGYDEFDDNLA
ncbi:MAG: AbrB/MazE/SpoVT family DNA-binding domain-containing protein [Terracidiphilus sp.]